MLFIAANIILKHPEIINLKSLQNRHIEYHILELLVRLNTPGLLEESTVRRLKQDQHRLGLTECILTSQAILEGTEIKSRNLGLNVLQQAKALGLRIEENEITKSWNIDITQKMNDIEIAIVFQKIGLAYEETGASKLGLWLTSQLIAKDGKTMHTWGQIKLLRSAEL